MFRASICLRGQNGVADRIPWRHFRRDVNRSINTEALLQSLVNHEQRGIPDGAGAKGNKGFDLVGQCLLLQRAAAFLVRLYSWLPACRLPCMLCCPLLVNPRISGQSCISLVLKARDPQGHSCLQS